MPAPTITRRVKSSFHLKLPREALIDLLNDQSRMNGEDPIVPAGAYVFVKVPSGGDYSGCQLDLLDENIPIEITWETDE